MSILRGTLMLLTGLGPTILNGCYATIQPEPAYVEASAVPADIEVYPHTYYEGHVVYFVNDHWYYRDGPRWVYYRSEPEPLIRQRAYVQRAPPARQVYHAPDRREYLAAPPARRELNAPPARREQLNAPPARRERFSAPPARRFESEPRAEQRQ